MLSMRRSTRLYEDWLAAQLRGEIVRADLRRKHDKMQTNPFAFLRATYWRWAETVLDVCPHLQTAPQVLAVGDIHLENFGTWRDVEGRLIWGVNDFDEAAEMPYALDLVRLATSTLLAHGKTGAPVETIAGAILRGYRRGLGAPSPTVLDRKNRWLHKLVAVSTTRRRDFWRDLDADVAGAGRPQPRYRKALQASMPEPGLELSIGRRQAGLGSLGRPRWVAVTDWRGGPLVREAKAVVPSAWCRAHDDADARIRCGDIAGGRYRAPDPWYAVAGGIVVSPPVAQQSQDRGGRSGHAHAVRATARCHGARAGRRAPRRRRPQAGDPARPRQARRKRLARGQRAADGQGHPRRLQGLPRQLTPPVIPEFAAGST